MFYLFIITSGDQAKIGLEINYIYIQILQEVNEQIRNQIGLQQWRSTGDALNWFKQLDNKRSLKFLQLDIVDFYPSINEKLFNAALDFAS